MVVKKRNDRTLRFYSMNFPELGIVETTTIELGYTPEHDWAKYPKGVLTKLVEAEATLPTGFDVIYYVTIPNGAVYLHRLRLNW
ncbi:hypothetical protein [Anaerobacillus alkaliphilus]|uniref:hypothetical protein n=1 Tax=Anaerobacillus alkaliphilus TaxID=1548597 RepID=UPI001F4FFD22|nr:hypothetical protein [Anaerobacillus alkaliphilus]